MKAMKRGGLFGKFEMIEEGRGFVVRMNFGSGSFRNGYPEKFRRLPERSISVPGAAGGQ
jgi:hypothetical protein